MHAVPGGGQAHWLLVFTSERPVSDMVSAALSAKPAEVAAHLLKPGGNSLAF